VYRSVNHIYVQVIDDLHGKTLVSAAPRKAKRKIGAPAQRGFGESDWKSDCRESKAKGLTKVVFDRGGYIYHGRVKVWPTRRAKRD